MPRLTYTPEGAEPKTWDFTFGRIKFGERAAIEKATGLGWQAVQKGFWSNHAEVIHAFLWVLLKRDISTLRAAEVDFMDDEIEIDLTDDEGRRALAGLRLSDELDEEAATLLGLLEERFAADVEPSGEAGEADPKED